MAMPLSPTDLITLSRLLDEAMDLVPEQVDAWFAGLLTEHEHLRPRLQEMLAAHRQSSHPGFMADGPRLPDAPDETVARTGDLVGPYRLIREIGRGGMGTVWLAERADGTLKRQIALKLPRLAWGAGLAERMARERDIGALLEHPHIARLYDAGVDAKGRPYLALEYVDGQPLDAWCEAQALSVRDRLRLFVQVARAVAYAHGRLVVHRDLKPSNVLVTADGQVHLLDFGIAKLLHEASAGDDQLTQEQGRVLTPHYASPEQIRGETITVGSDVYSLGVLLYELLTWRYPYAPGRKSLAAIEEAIANDEPPLASSRASDKRVAKELRGEIDAILAKALRRETNQRYATADAFAEDIERHLKGDAVLARPHSVGYHAARVLRRHWVGLSASAAVLLAVLTGSAMALVQSQRAASSAERERIVKEFVVEVFRINQPNTPANRELHQLPAEMLLEHGAKLIETKFPKQPRLQAELYGVVGSIYADMGASYAAAQYAGRQVKALADFGANDSEQATAVLLLTQSLVAQGRLNDALVQARSAVRLSPRDTELKRTSLVWLARVLFQLGRFDQVGPALADAVREHGSSNVASAAHARAEGIRAELLCEADRVDEALPVFRAAIDEAISAEGIYSLAAVDIRLTATTYLLSLERVSESQKFSEPALVALHASGTIGTIRAAVEEARLTRSTFRADGMSFEEARQVFERLRSKVAAMGPNVPAAIGATIDFEYGAAMLLWGDVERADGLLTASAELLRPITEAPSRIGFMDMYLGHLAMFLGRNGSADVLFLENLNSKKHMQEVKNRFVVSSYIYPAINLDMQGRYEEAKAILAMAPNVSGNASSPIWSHPSEEIRSAYARIELDSGQPLSALALMPPQEHDEIENLLLFSDQVQLRGEILCALGRRAEGLGLMERAIARKAAADIYPNEAKLARARAVEGLCALSDNQRAKAEQLARLSRSAFEGQPRLSEYITRPSRQLDAMLAKTASTNRLRAQ